MVINNKYVNQEPIHKLWIIAAIYCGVCLGSSLLFGMINITFWHINGFQLFSHTTKYIQSLLGIQIGLGIVMIVLLGIVYLYYRTSYWSKLDAPILISFIGLIMALIPPIGLFGTTIMGIGGLWLSARSVQIR